MDARVEGLADTIKNTLQKLSEDAKIKSYLDGNKVVSVVGIDGVRVRIAEPAKPRKQRQKLSEVEVTKMKEVKKAFKDDLNISNLLVLLIRIKEELNRVNIKKVPKEKMEIVTRTFAEVSKELGVKLLGVTER